MRCSRHNKVRCTYPACIREAAAGAVDGPSVDDYSGGGYISPGTYTFVRDDALPAQVAPFMEQTLLPPLFEPTPPNTSIDNYELEDH